MFVKAWIWFLLKQKICLETMSWIIKNTFLTRILYVPVSCCGLWIAIPMLWKKILPQTSGSSDINPQDRGRMFLRKVGVRQKHLYVVRTQNTTLWTITDKQTWNDRPVCTCFGVILQCCVMHKRRKCYTVVKAREGCLGIMYLKAPSPHLAWVTHSAFPNICSPTEIWNRMSEMHFRI